MGDDTDLLILLYYVNGDGCDLFFHPEPKVNTSQIKVWNMRQVKKDLGVCLSRHMLFIHAISGCDTTSRPYGIGKVATLKKFADSSSFCRHADLFDASS